MKRSWTMHAQPKTGPRTVPEAQQFRGRVRKAAHDAHDGLGTYTTPEAVGCRAECRAGRSMHAVSTGSTVTRRGPNLQAGKPPALAH